MSRTKHHGYKAKERAFGETWRWLDNEPKWWRKMYKHKPQRGRQRQCIHQVMRDQENIDWPLDRKPWNYYW